MINKEASFSNVYFLWMVLIIILNNSFQLKDAADKVVTFRSELERSQQAKRNQLKIMKKTYETHLSEKEETIQTLHELVEEQDNNIINLHSQLVGESSTDDDAMLTSYKSVKKLADRLGSIQQEKSHLTATLMKTENRMSKLEEEKDKNNDRLDKEKNDFERTIRRLERELKALKVWFLYNSNISHAYTQGRNKYFNLEFWS